MKRMLIWASLAVLLINCRVLAWPDDVATNAQLVARSELIVVGHLKRDSLTHQPRSNSHAILVITRIIKGSQQSAEIPISMSLLPAPNTFKSVDDFANADLSPRIYDWTKPIVLFDNNPDGGSQSPLVDDIRKDQIWLLRNGTGKDPNRNAHDKLSILAPLDVQPLTKEQQLKAEVK